MKKLYLTKKEIGKLWNYVGDPLHPNTTFDVGLVEVHDNSEVKFDDFGIYVERDFTNLTKEE